MTPLESKGTMPQAKAEFTIPKAQHQIDTNIKIDC